MSEHARLSFSGSDRWLLCPASVNMSAGLPDRESEAAREGSLAHWVMEQTLRMWEITGDPEVGEIVAPPEYADVVTDLNEMAKHVQACVDFVIEEFEDLPGDNKGIAFEQRVSLHYMTNRDDLWGTSDIQMWSDEVLKTFDLKYGKGIFVDANTTQNKLYTLGKMCEFFKEWRHDIPPWESVYSVIMQPRYPDAEGYIFREHEYTPEELMNWFDNHVKPALGMTDDPPPPNPGDKQCQFCLARPDCKEARAYVQANLPFVVQDPVNTVPGVEDLDVNQLVQIHDNIPFITGYLKSVTERLGELIKARDPATEGKLKMVRTRKQTQYAVDEAEVIETLVAGKGRTVKEGYIPKKNFVAEKPLTAAALLKLKLNKEQRARVESLVSKSEGSLAIVPWEDERPNAFPPLPFEGQEEVADEQLFDFI